MATITNISNTPANAIELMNNAEMVFDEANYNLSIQYYTKAIQQNIPSNDLAYALYMRGCAYKEIGNQMQAHNDWKKAQSLGYEHPLGIDLIALALEG